MKNKFMQKAIELSIESINSGGGPFGSVIVKGDKIMNSLYRFSRSNDSSKFFALDDSILNMAQFFFPVTIFKG